MAHVCAELVGARLCEHPAIANRPEWLQLASAAEGSLQALYQAIGAVHLEDPAGKAFA